MPPQIQDNPEDAFQVINPDLHDFQKTITDIPSNIGPSKTFFDDLKEITED
jgi:hypothetical protein